MKKRIKNIIVAVLSAVLICLCGYAGQTNSVLAAYHFVMTGASEEGTVSVVAEAGTTRVNGYGRAESYRITYTISRSWTAFDERTGGYFLVGNSMDAGGGCQFAYHTSGGAIWEDGAIILGRMSDGREVCRCDATSETVSCSFTVGSLDEIPDYIAYAYEPAGSAYLHIGEDYGINGHIWCYKNLKNTEVYFEGNIDRSAPSLSVSIVPVGNTVNINGKLWAESAKMQIRAEDPESGPGGIRIYQNGVVLYRKENSQNEMVFRTEYPIPQNGTYEADGYDKLNNTCSKEKITVSCIDGEAPVIQNVAVRDTDFVKETRITVSASDNGCGLHDTPYSWNGGTWTDANAWKIEENGSYFLKVRDALGNESSETVVVSNIDREAPEISVKVTPGGKVLTYQGVLWSTKAGMSVEAVDSKSGVKEICVLDEEGNQLKMAQSPEDQGMEMLAIEEFDIKNGSYKIWAADRLGNQVSTKEITLAHIDGAAPMIKSIKQTDPGDGTMLLTVDAEDAKGGIGLADQAFSIDGGKTWQKEPVFVLRESGTYEICVKDRLGQIVSQSTKIIKKEESSPKANDDRKEQNAGDDAGTRQEQSGINSEKIADEEITGKNSNGSVSENSLDNTEIRTRVVESRDAYAGVTEKQTSVAVSGKSGNEKAAQIVLAVLLGVGILGLALYLMLFYLRYSCVLYEIDEKQNRRRLCRIFLKNMEEEWYAEVPDSKLGVCGTGKYILTFHPSFIKEETPGVAVVRIDGKMLREGLAEEIRINI